MDTSKNKFLSNKGFVLFSILAVIVVLIAVFAPVLAGGIDPTAGNLADSIMAPDSKHLFGTDKMGRDIYARVLYGARISLASTFVLVLAVFVIGTALGVLAGYFGGWVDAIIMRIADMMIAFPGLVLAIAVAGMLGASMRNAIIAIALVTWPKYARMAVCSHRYRFQYLAHALEIHVAEYYYNACHYSSHGYRRYDDGTCGLVLPGIWRAAAHAGMGFHAE